MKQKTNIKEFNMIRINELKKLVKHISCDCISKFISTTCNWNQKWNNDKCQCEYKKHFTWEKDFSWNGSIRICKNR